MSKYVKATEAADYSKAVLIMCEFQKYDYKNPLPICEYTKELCMYCLLGNMKTYYQAKEALKERENNA